MRMQLDMTLVNQGLPDMQTLLDPQSSDGAFPEIRDWNIRRGSFQGGPSAGIEVIELNNGLLSVFVLPTRGMGIWKAKLKETEVGWQSPVPRPVHPQFVDLQGRNGFGWLDGFNELICRCGLSFNGPPGLDEGNPSPIESQLTLHGKIANLPAHSVEVFADDTGGVIGVTGVVDESTLFGPRLRMTSTVVTRPGSRAFVLRDDITNLGAAPAELELLYHTNIGSPFLEEGATLHCPVKSVVPRDARAAEDAHDYATYLGPTPGYAEQCYFFDLLADADEGTLALLANKSLNAGVSLHFRKSHLPCFTLWKCTQAERSGYVTGLEPGTNFPNFKSYERRQGRVISLAPGETHTAELRLEVHTTAEAVQSVRESIRAIQRSTKPTIHPHPIEPFCPVD